MNEKVDQISHHGVRYIQTYSPSHTWSNYQENHNKNVMKKYQFNTVKKTLNENLIMLKKGEQQLSNLQINEQ